MQLFLVDRLVGLLREQGYSAQEVDAVVALRPDRWGEIPRRLAAVRAFAALPEAPALAAANKRVGNILKKSEEGAQAAVDAAQLVEPAERALADALAAVGPRADAAFAAGDLTGALREQGYSAQEVEAVLSLAPQRLSDVPTRLAAVRAFAALPEAPALFANHLLLAADMRRGKK